MASQSSKFAVGLFVASGIVIVTTAVIWLGTSRYLQKGMLYATYFNESVQGLEIDSPVKFRGVSIGRVESIGVAPDAKLIEVVMKMDPGKRLKGDMVAQLKSVGITGSMFIELDLKSPTKPDLSPEITFPAGYPIVPSRPSEIRQLLSYVDDIMAEIKGLDLPGISTGVKSVLGNIDRAVMEADIKSISGGIQSTLEGANRILDAEQWGRIMDSVETAGKSLNHLMRRMDRSFDTLDSALARVDAMIGDNREAVNTAINDMSQAVRNANRLMEESVGLVSGTNDAVWRLKKHLVVVAQNLERATEGLNVLIESLSDQPSQLLFDRRPVPRKVADEDVKQ